MLSAVAAAASSSAAAAVVAAATSSSKAASLTCPVAKPPWKSLEAMEKNDSLRSGAAARTLATTIER